MAISPAILWGWPRAHDPQQHQHQTVAGALPHVTISDAGVPTIIAQPQILDMAPVQLEPEFRYVNSLLRD